MNNVSNRSRLLDNAEIYKNTKREIQHSMMADDRCIF